MRLDQAGADTHGRRRRHGRQRTRERDPRQSAWSCRSSIRWLWMLFPQPFSAPIRRCSMSFGLPRRPESGTDLHRIVLLGEPLDRVRVVEFRSRRPRSISNGGCLNGHGGFSSKRSRPGRLFTINSASNAVSVSSIVPKKRSGIRGSDLKYSIVIASVAFAVRNFVPAVRLR